MISRLKVLATGRVEWCNPHTGEVEEVEHMSWRDRWSVFGVHSYSWKWVRRLGAMHCGCTRNPITRRMVMFRVGCDDHCRLDLSDAALMDTDS